LPRVHTSSAVSRAASLLVRVMQAWERCAGTHTPQAVIPQPVQSSRCTVFSSHLIHHTSPVSSGIKYSSRDSPRISHSSRTALTCTQCWRGSSPAPPSREKLDGIISYPPPIPYSSAVSVAAPCVGAPGCHGFSPHVQATWPTVQSRQLTKPGSPGFRQSHRAD
jgi:hypothetical protein